MEKQFLSKNVVFIKNECNCSYLDYLDFRAQLGRKINDLLEIENTDTLYHYNFSNKPDYAYQSFVVNWS